MLGWQAEPRTLMGETVSTFSPSGPLVGYVRGEVIYLEPDAAYATAQRLASAQGGAISMSEKTLWKRLGQDGLLAKADAGKNTTKIAVGSRRPRTVAIPAAHILSAEWGQRGHWGQASSKPMETHDSSADFVPPKSKSAEKWGHGMGAGAHGGGWADQKLIRGMMLFLHGHGMGTSRAVRILRRRRGAGKLGELLLAGA